MRKSYVRQAKLVVRVIGNKSTKEIITESVFDNRSKEFWSKEQIEERGIACFLNLSDMKETLNWNLNGDESKYQFRWGQTSGELTEGVAHIVH